MPEVEIQTNDHSILNLMTWFMSGEDGCKYLFLGKEEMQHLLVVLHTPTEKKRKKNQMLIAGSLGA